MSQGKFLFTSESVSMGHPDKLADQISDGVLDALFEQDPYSRVACETMVTTGIAIIAGEITTRANVDYSEIVRRTIRDVGYTDASMGIAADTCAVMVSDRQAEPGYCAGSGCQRNNRQGCRSGRPGLDVWLCVQRHSRTDAVADCFGPQTAGATDGRAGKRAKSTGCGPTARAR